MECEPDWWCPDCGSAASFRGTGKFQFGHCNACRCQWLMFASAKIGPTSASDSDYLEAFIPSYRLVRRRRDAVRPLSLATIDPASLAERSLQRCCQGIIVALKRQRDERYGVC